jgi:hypothetical protein
MAATVMITVKQAGLDTGKADLTARMLGVRVIHGWRDDKAGAAWIIEATADSTGLREQLRIIWEGSTANVEWWSPMPGPNAIYVPA